jgi:hypothetical protein
MRAPRILPAAALLLAAPLGAQVPQPGSPAVAGTYLERYREIMQLRPTPEQAAAVSNLTLRRDAGEFHLAQGRLYLLPMIGGRVVGAVFRGTGTFRLDPLLEIERQRLRLFGLKAPVERRFEDLVLLFADGTHEELSRSLRFETGPSPEDLGRRVEQALDLMGHDGSQTLDPDLVRPFLNGEQTGYFYAFVVSEGWDPLGFVVNPQEVEAIQLLTRAKARAARRYGETVVQFPARGTLGSGEYQERRPEARIGHYEIAIQLPQTGTGDLAFSAHARVDITADTTIGPWVAFIIYPRLEVDSGRWQNGAPATLHQGKESPYLWVRTPAVMKPREVQRLQLFYHGDLIDRFGDWFFIRSSIQWYPVSLDGRTRATFDLTFTSPQGFRLVSVGRQVDSAPAGGHMQRTRWVVDQPIRNASFNVGLFEEFRVTEPDIPPVTVLWSDRMHLAVAHGAGVLRGKNMKQQVGGDIAAAMQFYQHVFGAAPVDRFLATEIPWLHGEAWPGIIGLSYVTFHQTTEEGFDEAFRAHEVAHQWFGIGVDYATYRDRWLSEGLSDFAGIWFLQTRRKDNTRYFDMLKRWRSSIMLRREEPLPIWLGHRVATSRTTEDYSAIVYQKGAWVAHMLRILLLDLKTMSEERFTATMQDFYQTYRGRRASTRDLQRVFEAHAGQPMDWFFQQWVYGSDIPTYRVAWRSDPGPDGTHLVQLRVDQERVPEGFLAYVPVAVELGNNQVARLRVKVTGARTELTLPAMPAKPREVRFNDLEGVLAEVKKVPW